MTFVAGANAISSTGGKYIFVDIDENANLDPDETEKKLLNLKKKKKFLQ